MESKPISKNDMAWLIVRLLGLVAFCSGVLSMLSFFGQMAVASKIPFNVGAGNVVFLSFLIASIQLGVGLYLLRFGNFVHGLLMFLGQPRPVGIPNPSQPSGRPGASGGSKTTLTLEETEEFKRWLENQPYQINDSLEDQIARFRDFQRGE